jgi:hypothetical protein
MIQFIFSIPLQMIAVQAMELPDVMYNQTTFLCAANLSGFDGNKCYDETYVPVIGDLFPAGFNGSFNATNYMESLFVLTGCNMTLYRVSSYILPNILLVGATRSTFYTLVRFCCYFYCIYLKC